MRSWQAGDDVIVTELDVEVVRDWLRGLLGPPAPPPDKMVAGFLSAALRDPDPEHIAMGIGLGRVERRENGQ